MKPPRTLSTSLVPLLCVLLVALLLPSLVACGPSSDTTLAPTTTLAPGSLGTIAPTAEQAANQAAGNILFRDDFQDGDTAGWQVDGSWVVQQDGDLYTFNTSGAGFAPVPKGVGWEGDYAFKALYALDAGTLAFSFDATRDGRYYVSVGPDLISLVKEDAADNKTVLTQAQAPEAGAQHFITMAKKNGTIQVYVDKTLWLAYQDEAPLAAGTITVGSTDGTTAWVDDVLVNKIGKPLPQAATAVEPIDPSQVVEPPDDGGGLDGLPDSDDDEPDLNDNNHPNDIPQPVASFTARLPEGGEPSNALTVTRLTELVLEWSVQDAQAVYLNGRIMKPVEDQGIKPSEDTRYELEVIGLDGVSHMYYVDITMRTGAEDDDGDDDGAPVGPDIVIQAQVSVQEGRRVRVSIHYWNVGDQAPDSCTIEWYPDKDNLTGGKSSSVSIPAGTDGVIDWQYTYDELGTKHWLAVANVMGPAGDADWSNNEVTGSVTLIPGG